MTSPTGPTGSENSGNAGEALQAQGAQAVAAVAVVNGPQPLTVDQFRAALPDKVRKSVSQEVIDRVNVVLSNPDLYENYRDNLLSFSRVMSDGKFTIEQYIAAVRYVSHKLMGDSHIAAYSKTFPEKIQRFAAQGVEPKDIASYVTAYNKSKLVNLLLEQTLVPVHILNMGMYQEALNLQMDLARNAKSEKVRADAANSILVQLKPPEVKRVELDIGIKEDSSIGQLREATMELARQQRQAIENGVASAQDIAHQRVVPKEFIDVEARRM
jgi:hypothetical protein